MCEDRHRWRRLCSERPMMESACLHEDMLPEMVAAADATQLRIQKHAHGMQSQQALMFLAFDTVCSAGSANTALSRRNVLRG